jgi:hypothetical protein
MRLRGIHHEPFHSPRRRLSDPCPIGTAHPPAIATLCSITGHGRWYEEHRACHYHNATYKLRRVHIKPPVVYRDRKVNGPPRRRIGRNLHLLFFSLVSCTKPKERQPETRSAVGRASFSQIRACCLVRINIGAVIYDVNSRGSMSDGGNLLICCIVNPCQVRRFRRSWVQFVGIFWPGAHTHTCSLLKGRVVDRNT